MLQHRFFRGGKHDKKTQKYKIESSSAVSFQISSEELLLGLLAVQYS